MSEPFKQKDMQNFSKWTGLFCFLFGLVPLYFLLQGEIFVGDHRKVMPWKIVEKAEEPQEYWLLMTGTVLVWLSLWAGRHYLLKKLSEQIKE